MAMEKVKIIRRFFSWLDIHKNEDHIFVQILELVYTIEICTFPHVVVSAVIGMIVPIVWGKSLGWSIFLLALFLAENVGYCICESYHDRAYEQRKLTEDILRDQSNLMSSMSILIHDTSDWKTQVFKKTSQQVCEKIREMFLVVFNSHTRVSVEYTFEKESNQNRIIYRKMAGRTSDNRSEVKKATELSSREGYYSHKIFSEKLIRTHYLTEREINDDHVWYKNPAHTAKVIQYVALVHSFNDADISFILQIDFLGRFSFGDNESGEEVEYFVNTYLKPYVNVVSIAYLLGCNENGKMDEV